MEQAEVLTEKAGSMNKLEFLGLCAGVIYLSQVQPLSAASAQRTDQLFWECEGKTPEGMGALGTISCGRYLDGIMDMHAVAVHLGMDPLFCAPDSGISVDQALRIFKKWASESPQELHKTARVSVLLALKAAFPCTRNQ